MLISSPAIILSKVRYQDNDLIVKCLTRDLGVVSYMIKNISMSKKSKNKFFTIAQIPELFSRTLTINGLSKSYAMTGWRVGYAGGPENIIQGIAKIQSQSTTNTSSISQAAAEEALNGTQDFIKKRSDAFKERRDFVVKKLNSIEGLSCKNPEGAFYVFPNCKDCIGKKDVNKKEIVNDTDFVTSLLENTGVAVVQGSAFGKELSLIHI